MHYRNLGRSGLKVSVVGLGTNRLGSKCDFDTSKRILHTALDLGVNFLDTANVYAATRSEEFIGEAIHDQRDRFVVATKVFGKVGDGPNDRGASRQHILRAVEDSLRRLKTDYIDLYQIHEWDTETPIDETLRALDDLVRAGKVRYIGASNFAAWQLCRANDLAEMRGWTAFVSVQPEYHMLERGIEAELVPYCKVFGVGILPYFPLAGGFLTGKYKRGQPAPKGSRGESSSYVQKYMTEAGYTLAEQLARFAEARRRSLTELALAWLLAQPQIACVISGATAPEHVAANVTAADWALSVEELNEINAILDGAKREA
jgi:aryl-alcohol dehydrogenase-like predicted oxidoreductase